MLQLIILLMVFTSLVFSQTIPKGSAPSASIQPEHELYGFTSLPDFYLNLITQCHVPANINANSIIKREVIRPLLKQMGIRASLDGDHGEHHLHILPQESPFHPLHNVIHPEVAQVMHMLPDHTSQCLRCNKIFESQEMLLAHVARRHGDLWKSVIDRHHTEGLSAGEARSPTDSSYPDENYGLQSFIHDFLMYFHQAIDNHNVLTSLMSKSSQIASKFQHILPNSQRPQPHAASISALRLLGFPQDVSHELIFEPFYVPSQPVCLAQFCLMLNCPLSAFTSLKQLVGRPMHGGNGSAEPPAETSTPHIANRDLPYASRYDADHVYDSDHGTIGVHPSYSPSKALTEILTLYWHHIQQHVDIKPYLTFQSDLQRDESDELSQNVAHREDRSVLLTFDPTKAIRFAPQHLVVHPDLFVLSPLPAHFLDTQNQAQSGVTTDAALPAGQFTKVLSSLSLTPSDYPHPAPVTTHHIVENICYVRQLLAANHKTPDLPLYEQPVTQIDHQLTTLFYQCSAVIDSSFPISFTTLGLLLAQAVNDVDEMHHLNSYSGITDQINANPQWNLTATSETSQLLYHNLRLTALFCQPFLCVNADGGLLEQNPSSQVDDFTSIEGSAIPSMHPVKKHLFTLFRQQYQHFSVSQTPSKRIISSAIIIAVFVLLMATLAGVYLSYAEHKTNRGAPNHDPNVSKEEQWAAYRLKYQHKSPHISQSNDDYHVETRPLLRGSRKRQPLMTIMEDDQE